LRRGAGAGAGAVGLVAARDFDKLTGRDRAAFFLGCAGFAAAAFFLAGAFFVAAAVARPFGAAFFFVGLTFFAADARRPFAAATGARAPLFRGVARADEAGCFFERAAERGGAAALRFAMRRSFLTLTVWR
jgi:hypothetical protein